MSPLAQLDLCALLGISFCGRHEGKHIVHARPDWADGHTLVTVPGLGSHIAQRLGLRTFEDLLASQDWMTPPLGYVDV